MNESVNEASIHSAPDRLMVGVGASAGGLKALETFFAAIAPRSGCTYIVVQHLSPDFKSVMDELLSRHTRIPIKVAVEGVEPEADTIYLVPPKMQVSVQDRRLILNERRLGQGIELPINLLFVSLAREYGPAAVGVVLSGTGSDGTEGLRAIHGDGGLVVVQSPETAEFDGMPRNALALGVADYVLAPEAMGAAIAAYARDPNARLEPASGAEGPAGEFTTIFTRLQQTCGIDFKPYKLGTVERRIRRRMDLHTCEDVPAYARLLAGSASEADLLYHDLLIGVTEFFRNPKVFETLRAEVLLPLFRGAGSEDVRAWCAACASGEEAYSLAILMDETARETKFTGRWSIFATDVHRTSLARAGQGIYNGSQLARLAPERRNRYFVREETGDWRIVPALRQRIVFAHHNLLADPPFTKLDLVTCRNLLIYFTPPAQERAIGLFHYGLRTGGALLLGLSEGPGRLHGEFTALDPKLKLYRKVGDAPLPLEVLAPGTAVRALRTSTRSIGGSPANVSISRPLLEAYDELLAQHAPPGFIVNEAGELVHCSGNAGRFLLPVSGRAEPSLVRRCDGELKLALVTLLAGVFKAAPRALSAHSILVHPAGGTETVDLTAQVLTRGRVGTALAFIAVGARAPRPTAESVPAVPPAALTLGDTLAQRIATLEQELQSHREHLQITVEELQTTNEELQASNEEMVASNEELQATNEELHSVNEELHTVNAELETRNVQLRELNEDLDNLFVSLEVGVLFIDRELRIRRFNGAVQRTFRLLPQDLGRPLDHISYQLGAQEELLAEAREVIATGRTFEREHRVRDGTWLLKRVAPFLSAQRLIEGAVLTFSDISETKRLQSRIELAIEASQLVWWEWDLVSDRLVTHAAGRCILGYDHQAIVPSSRTWFDLTHPDDVGEVRATLDATLRGDTALWSVEHRYRAQRGEWVWVSERGRVTERDPAGKATRMLGTTQDINARREAERALQRDAEVLARLSDAVVCADEGGDVRYWSVRAREFFGLAESEALGRPLARIFPETVRARIEAALAPGAGEETRRVEWEGRAGWCETQFSAYAGPAGRPEFIALSRDITERRSTNARLRDTERQLLQSQKMETLGTLAGGIAHDFNNLLTAILGSAELAAGELTADHPGREHIGNVRLAGRRATDLVRQILAFSRTGSLARENMRPGPFLKEIFPLLRSSLPATIGIELVIEPSERAIHADCSQFQQVIFNLSTNAAHAMRAGGTLRLVVDTVVFSEPAEVLAGTVAAGRYLRIAVADEGTGVDESAIPRMLEPFFTTKPTGEGTGLGLSIVHGVLTSHRGGLRLINRPGLGATFEVLWPEIVGAHPLVSPAAREIRAGKGEVIALVDDEMIVTGMQRALLKKHGYQPLVFNHAGALLEHLKTPGVALPLVIVTDQTMPQMTGLEMIRVMRTRGHGMPVVLTSGFTHGTRLDEARKIPGVVFVPKPFDHVELLAAIHGQLQVGAVG